MNNKSFFDMMKPKLPSFKKSKKNTSETFGSSKECKITVIQEGDCSDDSSFFAGYTLIDITLRIIAVYFFALPCMKNGKIDITQIILAIIFGPLYIIYRLFYPCVR